MISRAGGAWRSASKCRTSTATTGGSTQRWGRRQGQVAALERQTAVLGSCLLYTTIYKGNGKSGIDNKNSLIFPTNFVCEECFSNGGITHSWVQGVG